MINIAQEEFQGELSGYCLVIDSQTEELSADNLELEQRLRHRSLQIVAIM